MGMSVCLFKESRTLEYLCQLAIWANLHFYRSDPCMDWTWSWCSSVPYDWNYSGCSCLCTMHEKVSLNKCFRIRTLSKWIFSNAIWYFVSESKTNQEEMLAQNPQLGIKMQLKKTGEKTMNLWIYITTHQWTETTMKTGAPFQLSMTMSWLHHPLCMLSLMLVFLLLIQKGLLLWEGDMLLSTTIMMKIKPITVSQL